MTTDVDYCDDNHHHSTSDQTPLLPRSRSPTPPPHPNNRWIVYNFHNNGKIFGIPRQQFIVTLVCCSMVLWADFGTFLMAGPKVRLYEAIACRDWYEKNDPGAVEVFKKYIPEEKCKLDPIQDRVAKITGWQPFFDNIPGILMALPMGTRADKIGRKPVMVWNYIGLCLGVLWDLGICLSGLKLELVWLQSIFSFIGGGNAVIIALILSSLSDVTPAEQRADVLFLLSAAAYATVFVAPPIGTFLMNKDLWLPVFIGVALNLTGFFFFFVLPETKDFKAAPEGSPAAARQDEAEGEEGEYVSLPENPQPATPFIHRQIHRFKEMVSFILEDVNVSILVFAAMVNAIGRDSINIFLQYVSKRYGWTLAKANMLSSVRAGFILVLLLIILPASSRWMRVSLKMSVSVKDLWICRFSVVSSTLSMFMTGLSPTVGGVVVGEVFYAMGNGYAAALRSLVTAMVDPNNIGRLYSAMAIFESVGSIVAGPLMTAFFRLGIKLGGTWLGLPFIFSGGLYAVMTVAMFLVRAK